MIKLLEDIRGKLHKIVFGSDFLDLTMQMQATEEETS
jgi:hypothetical protein